MPKRAREPSSPDVATKRETPVAASSSSIKQEVTSPTPSVAKPERDPALIVVLEKACLEVGKVGKEHVLLNCDDHAAFLRKHKRDPAELRPDILHQCMLILLDSPLNKAGLLKLYVRTEAGVLINVDPQIRIPRTFRRFCGLMAQVRAKQPRAHTAVAPLPTPRRHRLTVLLRALAQLLHKLSIRASNGSAKLLKVIKNPVTDHLPPNCRTILLSVTGQLVSLPAYVPTLPDDRPVVFVCGAMAHGKVEPEYQTDECIAISEYPLSGAAALGRLCAAFENKLGIL